VALKRSHQTFGYVVLLRPPTAVLTPHRRSIRRAIIAALLSKAAMSRSARASACSDAVRGIRTRSHSEGHDRLWAHWCPRMRRERGSGWSEHRRSLAVFGERSVYAATTRLKGRRCRVRARAQRVDGWWRSSCRNYGATSMPNRRRTKPNTCASGRRDTGFPPVPTPPQRSTSACGGTA